MIRLLALIIQLPEEILAHFTALLSVFLFISIFAIGNNNHVLTLNVKFMGKPCFRLFDVIAASPESLHAARDADARHGVVDALHEDALFVGANVVKRLVYREVTEDGVASVSQNWLRQYTFAGKLPRSSAPEVRFLLQRCLWSCESEVSGSRKGQLPLVERHACRCDVGALLAGSGGIRSVFTAALLDSSGWNIVVRFPRQTRRPEDTGVVCVLHSYWSHILLGLGVESEAIPLDPGVADTLDKSAKIQLISNLQLEVGFEPAERNLPLDFGIELSLVAEVALVWDGTLLICF